ncbi:MAG TPA: hypothetical protein VJ553_00835 [Candidatus Paceibacterota bacterium]|nr:hypothetical protein [Candidatus Paceibacterota bacterium]
MTYGAFQDGGATTLAAGVPGLIVNEMRADISSNFAVETAAGIGLGKVVSRGTDEENQVVIGGATPADVLGITCMCADVVGPGVADGDNEALYDQYQLIPVIHSGYVWAYLAAGTADAGSQDIWYHTGTGVLRIGTAATHARLYGATLWTTVSVGGSIALLKLTDARGDQGYVTSVALNSGVGATGAVNLAVITGVELNSVAVTPVAGVADLTVIEGIELNSVAVVPTAGVADLAVVESVQTNAGAAFSGDLKLVNGTLITLVETPAGTVTVNTSAT